jgi:hypothetical protein
MPRRENKQKNEPKNSTPSKPQKVHGPSVRERRHDRNIHKAEEARAHGKRGGRTAQAKIDAKAATRRRQAARTPAQRAEASAAGREHRRPRFR